MIIKQLMSGMKGEVTVYVDGSGRCSVLDFIESLPAADQRRVLNLLILFSEQGEIRNKEKFIHQEDDIHSFKSADVRILCSFLPSAGKRLVVLLHALRVKSNPVARKHLDKVRLLLSIESESTGGIIVEPKERLLKLLERYKSDTEFMYDGLRLQVAEKISVLMAEQETTLMDIAKSLSTRTSYVKGLLRCSENPSLKRLVQLSEALKATLSIYITPKPARRD